MDRQPAKFLTLLNWRIRAYAVNAGQWNRYPTSRTLRLALIPVTAHYSSKARCTPQGVMYLGRVFARILRASCAKDWTAASTARYCANATYISWKEVHGYASQVSGSGNPHLALCC